MPLEMDKEDYHILFHDYIVKKNCFKNSNIIKSHANVHRQDIDKKMSIYFIQIISCTTYLS